MQESLKYIRFSSQQKHRLLSVGFGKWKAKQEEKIKLQYLALGKGKNNLFGDFIKVLSATVDEDTNKLKVELVDSSDQKNEILKDFISYFENQCY